MKNYMKRFYQKVLKLTRKNPFFSVNGNKQLFIRLPIRLRIILLEVVGFTFNNKLRFLENE